MEASTYDIDAILATTDAKAVVPALVDAIGSRKTRKMFGRELDIFWLERVHGGVFIDGIYGVLVNYDLSVLVFAVKGMERIGAVQRASILKQAVDSFGDEARVGEVTKNFRPAMVTPEQKRLFEELDSRYYKASESFSDLAVAYIKQHVEDFRGYGMRN
jgi:Domain of unknown function (DUF4375)